MDKLLILKAFEKMAFHKPLGADGIRLYLLLLADCDIQMRGRIEYRTIKDALGKEFTAARLKQLCRRLSGQNFIEVVLPLQDEKNAGNFTMEYRLVPLVKECRDQRKNDGRQRCACR